MLAHAMYAIIESQQLIGYCLSLQGIRPFLLLSAMLLLGYIYLRQIKIKAIPQYMNKGTDPIVSGTRSHGSKRRTGITRQLFLWTAHGIFNWSKWDFLIYLFSRTNKRRNFFFWKEEKAVKWKREEVVEWEATDDRPLFLPSGFSHHINFVTRLLQSG